MKEVLAEASAKPIPVKFFIRGELIEGAELEFSGRGGETTFVSANPSKLLNRIVLRDPQSMVSDFKGLKTSDIVDFLVALGEKLEFDRNPLMQEACRVSTLFSGLTPSILEGCYRRIPLVFSRPALESLVENEVGINFLDGWVEVPVPLGRAKVRAYGAKTLHIIAGNVPLIAAISVIRGALIKADNIIKLPSNDPLTATAILTTMHEFDPGHPLVKHFVSVYWKGGDSRVERPLITPQHLEKIIAWGGHNSVKHIKNLVGPGIDLITLDPKFSISVIGAEAFTSEDVMRQAAGRAALDAGTFNQEACVNSRTQFVQTTPEKAARYGELLYQALQELHPSISTRPKHFPAHLRENLESLRYMYDFYHVAGGEKGEGAVVTSLTGDPVDFFPSCKVVNVIPFNEITEILPHITVATQCVGIYPEPLKEALMDSLVAQGVQRFVSLGKATEGGIGVPSDAIEPMRRACKWIVNEIEA
ncbi:MAG: long-chain-fatty-acyl-CoA reductase [Chloroflexi bacterium]|uniref:Long-chain-fatty-acyl-CoA reductase n=1 Tax=Candidatus Chlorohelix allophototropha TaxID=3003348 RepID=A0A8T7M648_9CHLR|nr:long-chain-fatty-acyl-CoA reductase [Chloroflexota bacterium]WJW69485.1 hypothetical protein OZ401_003101 [Chloroflexota bacterium L227-S17]